MIGWNVFSSSQIAGLFDQQYFWNKIINLQLLYTCLAADIFKPRDFVGKHTLATTDRHVQPFSVLFVQNRIVNFLFHPCFSKVIDWEISIYDLTETWVKQKIDDAILKK